MKHQLYSILKVLSICLACVSCKTSTEPEAKKYSPIPVSPSGQIGNDLFYSTWPDTAEAPLDAGIHSLNFDGSGSAFLFRRVSLYSAPRDSVLLFSALDTVLPLSWLNGVYLGDLKGRTIKKIFSAQKYFYYVILSPDAQKILYSTYDSVYVYDIPTHSDRILMAQPTYSEIVIPVFSDDSKKILFTGGSNNGWSKGLYIINTDGSNLTQIDTGNMYPKEYDWSPDGKSICYNSNYQSGLCIKELATGKIDTFAQALSSAPIQWSPKGNYIAYTEWINGTQSPQYRIGILNILNGQVIHCELPAEIKYTSPNAIEWSADENSLYVSMYADTYYKQSSTLLKVNSLTGSIIENYHVQGIQFASLFRLKTIGEH